MLAFARSVKLNCAAAGTYRTKFPKNIPKVHDRIYIDGVMLPVRAAKEADFSRVALSNLRSIVQQFGSQNRLNRVY